MTTFNKLTKCAQSLENQVFGGTSYKGLNNARTLVLVDRFEALKYEATKSGVWAAWCEADGSHVDHDAYGRCA